MGSAGTLEFRTVSLNAENSETTRRPVAESERIGSLDVLRGFALLGILLLNILGFGLASSSYSNPGFDLGGSTNALDVPVWATVELFAEGAMRCLFSILFGAGVVLFTTGERGRGAKLHYKRTFWLLVFGLIDAYLLLWQGDILVLYAVAGALLYWVRNWRARNLLILATLVLVATTALHTVTRFGLGHLQRAATEVTASADPESLDATTLELANAYEEAVGQFELGGPALEAELEARRTSYLTAFRWNAPHAFGMHVFVMPVFLLWDALIMMLIGMALFKLGVLQGKRSKTFYSVLALAGFTAGLLINGYEVTRSLSSDFALLDVFAQAQPTYHFGRLGIGLGWLGLVVLFSQSSLWPRLRAMLAAVGRMALTNYLLHSVIALFVFTGAGLGLVGRLDRAELYWIVLAIWVFQLVASDWWMKRYSFGPLEWLWRFLTYGKAPALRRTSA